jgi:hypothetical protein
MITADGFEWKDVTEIALGLFNSVLLFEVDDNEADHQIETKQELIRLLESGTRIYVEMGYVESEHN